MSIEVSRSFRPDHLRMSLRLTIFVACPCELQHVSVTMLAALASLVCFVQLYHNTPLLAFVLGQKCQGLPIALSLSATLARWMTMIPVLALFIL